MKTITTYISQMFAVLMGIVISLSVSGQMAGDLRNCDNAIHKSHFLFEKPAQPSCNLGYEAGLPVYKSTQGSFPQEIPPATARLFCMV